jgi:SRSO17 transposase
LQTSHLGIIQIDAPLPSLDLPPEEIVVQADELVRTQAAWVERQDREDQVHGVCKYLKGMIRRIKRKSVEPSAPALEANNVQSMQELIGQDEWQHKALLLPWRLVDETAGKPIGVVIVDRAMSPKPGEHSMKVVCRRCGRWGKVDNDPSQVFTAYASRQGHMLLDLRRRARADGTANPGRQRPESINSPHLALSPRDKRA